MSKGVFSRVRADAKTGYLFSLTEQESDLVDYNWFIFGTS